MSLEAENALFALFAVKQGLVSENHVERALGQLEGGQSLADALVAKGRLNPDAVAQVRDSCNAEIFPGYRIEGEAGRGGMGVVYRARQLSMDRLVALKVLTRRLSSDEAYVEKFLTEARSAAKLNHEHIVAAIDAGSVEDLHYFAMEFVDGASLADVLEQDGPLPWVRAFEIGEQIARALGHAHHAGLVHRDVKPENVLVTSDGQAKLCDLGLAKPSQVAGTGEKADMTEGTPYYCSPEQALGRTDIDPKSDIYSLGITIYTLIKGEPPFDGDTPRAILIKQVKEPFPDLAQALPDVPETYRALIADMVIKDRAKRLESSEAFAERLDAARREATKSGRTVRAASGGGVPLGPIVGGVTLLIGIGVVLGLSMPGEPDPSPSPSPEGSVAVVVDTPPPRPTRGPVRVNTPPRVDPHLGDEGLREAKKAFDAAEQFAKDHPADPAGAAERYAAVASKHPGTGYASRARTEAERLEKEAARSNQRALDTLSNQVLGLLSKRQFREAFDLVSTFRKARGGSEASDLRIGRIEEQVHRQADARGAELSAVLAATPGDAAARKELVELVGLLTGEPQRRAQEALDRSAQVAAQARWQRVFDEALRAFERGGARAAQTVLEGAKGQQELAPFEPKIRQTLSDVAAAGQVGRSLDLGLSGLASQGEVTLKLASGEVLVGRILSWGAQGGRFAPKEKGPERDLKAIDLAPSELLRWALPPGQGRANVLLFLARGLPGAADLAYQAYRQAGGEAVPLLEARIKTRVRAAAEAGARALVTELGDPALPPSELAVRLGRVPIAWRKTQAYTEAFPKLREAFVAGRAKELGENPTGMFKGEVKDRRGKIELLYDFKQAEQARDFRPSAAHHKDSALELKEEQLQLKGVVFLEARFLPGYLKVSFKVTERDEKAPNLNVWLGADQGPWQGLLAAGGFSVPGVDSLKIDTQARKRAGYVVDLPAHALIQLAGTAPERRMPGVLAADTKPDISRGRTVSVTLTTSDKGLVKYKLGSRIPINTSVPGLAQGAPSFIAIAPLGSTIKITELEITGKLDPDWLVERCKAVAAQEAAALPGPIK